MFFAFFVLSAHAVFLWHVPPAVNGVPMNPGSVINRPPFLLIPPLGGTEIYAKLHDADVPLNCPRDTDWERIWYPSKLEMLLPECWTHKFSLVYNATADTYASGSGIETMINTTLAAQVGSSTGPYSHIAPLLVQKFGYVMDDDLLTFAYDWRVGPHQWALPGGYFDQMKAFFEQTYAAHNNTALLVLSMSMGGPWFADFLVRHVDQAWKDKHISAFFSLSGPYAGAAIATMNQIALSNGWSDHHVPFIDKVDLMHVARTMGCVTWMAPMAEWWNDTVFFETTDGTTYNASQFASLFRAADCDTTAQMWEQTRLYPTLSPPNVRGYFYYGFNVSTPQKYTYPPDFTGENPINVTYVSGDGVASVRSLGEVPALWQQLQTQKIVLRPFANCTHNDPLFKPEILTALTNDIAALINETFPW